MPKRKREDSEEYLLRKLQKIEKKLRRRRKHRSSSRSSMASSSPKSPAPLLLQQDVNEHEIDLDGDVNIVKEVDKEPEAGTSPVDQPVGEGELDEDLMALFGETPSKERKFGEKIQRDLALRWEHISTCGLVNEERKELLERHLVPENCKKIEAPVLNPEIKAAMSEWLLKKDKALEKKQSQQTAAISCIGKAITWLVSSSQRDTKVIKLLIDAGRIMCDSHHKESLTRRSLICTSLKKELKDQLYNTEIDKFLFGESLADTLRAAKAINKSASELKLPTQSKVPNKTAPSKNLKFQRPNTRPPIMKRYSDRVPMQAPRPAPPPRSRQPPPPPPPPPRYQPRGPAPRHR